ncbi:MAG: hypothetical protein JNM84_17110, partial [Planctomycetes bacterium]|nr:hypothetical protein [Planctomycetota bacterium]
MPVTWFALAALLTLAAPQDAPPSTRSVDELDAACRAAYQALASGRLEPLTVKYPSAEEMQAYNTWRLRNESAEERQRVEELVRKRGGMEQVRKDELKELGARLEQARAKGARHFAWKNAHYVGALPPRRSTPDAANAAFETAEVEFLVSADGELWSFGAKFA